MADGDPFSCFDDNEEGTTVDDVLDAAVLERSDECGVLTFHHGTERALLVHIENEKLRNKNQLGPSLILELIDSFCTERHWMMHVGPEKAKVLEAFLFDCLRSKSEMAKDQFILLELGTYCGYSSILWAKLLMEQGVNAFIVYTVEASRENAAVASRLISLAGLQEHISVLLLDLNHDQTVVDLIKGTIGERRWIDLLFLDHDKDAYLKDLTLLEHSGLVRAGTHVAADNVVFARIDTYRSYVNTLAEKGVVATKLVEGSIEYSGPDESKAIDKEIFRDGIGMFMTWTLVVLSVPRDLVLVSRILLFFAELTVYLKDP